MADSPSFSSALAERLTRLDRALDALDRALGPGQAKSAVSATVAQQAALSELQGRIGRLVAHLEKAVRGAAIPGGGTRAAD